jgi:hypothetical protein
LNDVEVSEVILKICGLGRVEVRPDGSVAVTIMPVPKPPPWTVRFCAPHDSNNLEGVNESM